MDPTKFIGIGQRFISRVHNRPIVLYPLEKIIDDVVAPLRNLKRQVRATSSTDGCTWNNQSIHLNPGILRTGGTDTPGSGKDLSGDQKRHERRQPTP